MTTIRTTCPRCGEVDMGPESILLSVRSNGREDRKIVALLVSAGVDIDRDDEVAQMHPELFDIETAAPRGPSPDTPTFTADDVIEFHYLLEDDAYIREFFAKRG
jgi:hypothetical protein